MNKKLLIILVSTMATINVGCTNTSALEASIANLSNEVDQLSSEVSSLKSEHNRLNADIRSSANEAKASHAEAMRANKRIDNIAASYKK
jgi:murein lipoprotein